MADAERSAEIALEVHQDPRSLFATSPYIDTVRLINIDYTKKARIGVFRQNYPIEFL